MKKTLKFLSILVAGIVLIFIGLSIFIGSLDADKYRPQLVDVITKQTGRTTKLNGPISFSLGLSGVHIAIQDASLGNPVWASRPNMAGMGKFDLSVGLLPLLTHHISINELLIENADILLETNSVGQTNWTFTATDKTTSSANPTVTRPSAPSTASSSEPSVSINKLSIINSQLAMRSADGKISSFNVSNMILTMQSTGANVTFAGDINGEPLTLKAKTGITNLLSRSDFPFDADVTFNGIQLSVKGDADEAHSKADISSYTLSSGKTTITGELKATWGGVRPTLNGTLNSDHIDLADFKSTSATPAESTPASSSTPSKRMFSTAPLPLGSLKSVDANLNVSVGEFPVGKDALKQISAKLSLINGNLSLAPVKAIVGGAAMDVQLDLDASQPQAHLTLGVSGTGIDLSDLQKLANMTPFMTGKAGANIQLSGTGESAHDIASSLGGIITITAENGEILTGAAADVSSALAKVFNPQGGNAALNCLAARFIAKNGVLNDNGILIDSTPSTVNGKGNINLNSETVDLTLHAKTKLVDIGGLVPPLQVTGTLSSPHYAIDAEGLVKNVVGSLAGGNVDILASSVPNVQSAPSGQNACIYTLDHPQASSSSGILPADAAGKASQKIQNIGNSLLNGLIGK